MPTGLETIEASAATAAEPHPDLPATRTSRALIAALGRGAPGRGRAAPGSDPPPFVWARVRAPRAKRTARAGWLTPAALAMLVADTRAGGPDARLDIIVPLDSDDTAVARVRALCAALDEDVRVSLHVQDEDATDG